ncbi:tetratricopeptide repeat protein [Cohnella yongneupensis]|uniref:Tetratricopeptide repeat protein n=1 Tax=Cohnella yongneupensis TaxID=425006 RepID=A0ABW0QXU4_9BACL
MPSQSDPMNPFEEAKALHNKGVDGDKKAVIQANELLFKLRATEPDDARIEAYYGSTLVLLGRDAVKILEKADKAEEGLDALNRAISLDANIKEIRFLRGNICLRLPESFFHCSKTAIEDFTFLLDRYKENSSYLTQQQVREVLQNLSIAYQNAGQPDQADLVLQRLNQMD